MLMSYSGSRSVRSGNLPSTPHQLQGTKDRHWRVGLFFSLACYIESFNRGLGETTQKFAEFLLHQLSRTSASWLLHSPNLNYH